MDIPIIKQTTGGPNPPMTLTLDSQILGEKRNAYIQLPEGYDRTQKVYPILCVLDGEWLFETVRANMRFYSEYEVMGINLPQMVVIGIENVDRDRDYVPTPDPQDPPLYKTAGEADLFAEFLTNELFPYFEKNFRVLPNRTVVGWSFSGLFALYSAVRHQDLFDAFLCIGPAIWWDDELVVKLMRETPLRKKKRVVITCGSNEKGGTVYESVQNLLKILEEQPVNLEYEYIEIDGVGHSWGIPEAVDRGFKHLFRNYLPSEEFSSLGDLKEYYAHLSQGWGFEVFPPDSPLIDLANKLLASKETDSAFEVLDTLLTISPNCSLGHFYMGNCLLLLDQVTDAVKAFQDAIDVELARPVPNFVYLQVYRRKIEKMSGSPQ